MASLRSVRRKFRKELHRTISAGEGNLEKLLEIAGGHFGRDVGYEVLIKTFLRNEVQNAVGTLRSEGEVETVGKSWKPVCDLDTSDVAIISLRRLKRVRGELQSQIDLALKHSRTDEVAMATRLLDIITQELSAREAAETSEVPNTA